MKLWNWIKTGRGRKEKRGELRSNSSCGMQVWLNTLKSGPEWGSIWQKEGEEQWETRRKGMQSLGKLARWRCIAEHPAHTESGSNVPSPFGKQKSSPSTRGGRQGRERQGTKEMWINKTAPRNKAGYAVHILWDNVYAQEDQSFIVNYSRHGTL